jgi:NTE family protein
LIDAYLAEERKGCYWGIRSNLENYRAPGKMDCPLERTRELAEIETRLAALDEETQERLINWGYAVCDASLRTHYDRSLEPGTFPYPKTSV